ncbi:MAG: hydantoinase B/oxoprolinase family protein, partial [Deltaproteobacteria bacterium]
QCHMTNTKNTSIEVLEMHYPLRLVRYAVRQGSGGRGRMRGGHGIVREWEALEDCQVSLLAERRHRGPYGLAGGAAGAPGRHLLGRNGVWEELPGKCVVELKRGDRLRVETPGGGGFGAPEPGP